MMMTIGLLLGVTLWCLVRLVQGTFTLYPAHR